MGFFESSVLFMVAIVIALFLRAEIRRRKAHRKQIAETEAMIKKSNEEFQHRQAVAAAFRAESERNMLAAMSRVSQNPFLATPPRSPRPINSTRSNRPTRSSASADSNVPMPAYMGWDSSSSSPSSHHAPSSYHGGGGSFDGGGSSGDWGSSSSSSDSSSSSSSSSSSDSSSSSSDSGSSCSSD